MSKLVFGFAVALLSVSLAGCCKKDASPSPETTGAQEDRGKFPSPNTPDGEAMEEHAKRSTARKGRLAGLATTSKVLGVVSIIGGPPVIVAGATTGSQDFVAVGATMVTAGVGLVAAGYLFELQARKAREEQISQELQTFRIFRKFCQDLAARLADEPTADAGVTDTEATECRRYGYVLAVEEQEESAGLAASGGQIGAGGSPGAGGAPVAATGGVASPNAASGGSGPGGAPRLGTGGGA
jgi:hypothetical protein